MSGRHVLVRVGEILNWENDWTDWLAGGDSILSRQWSIDPSGPSLTDATTASVTVDTFVSGKVYRLREDVVTTNGLSGVRDTVLRTA